MFLPKNLPANLKQIPFSRSKDCIYPTVLISLKRQGGFTLIEVLIGMSLLSLIMLLLFGSLRISARNWDAGEQRIAEVSQMAAVQNFFRRYLSTAKPVQQIEKDDIDDEQSGLAFVGGHDSVDFVASLPASAGRLGLQIFSVKLQSEDDSKAIMVAIKPFYPAADDEEWEKEEVELISGIRQFKLSYFGIFKQHEQAEWHEDWKDQDELPYLVKVEIEFDNGMYWPAMIVANKINATNPSPKAGLRQKRDENEVDDVLMGRR